MKRLWHVAIGVALGLVLALAAQPILSLLAPDPPPPVRAVPDSQGALEHIVIHYTAAAGDLVERAYADLLGTLAPEVRVDVVVETQAHFDDLVLRLDRHQVEHPGLTPVVVGFPITPWSRDRYTLARQGDEWLLLVPERTDGTVDERQNDWRVPWELAQRMPHTTVATLPFRFDGGDLLITEDRVFASYRLAEKNLGLRVASVEQLVSELEHGLGRPVFLFGDAPRQVPLHHVGMYLTPLPDGRVAIGDPTLAVDLIGRDAALALGADLTDASLARFRAVAQVFEAAGYDLVRFPLLPLEGELDYITYNNVLLETRRAETHVWVPVYELPELDAAGLAAWSDLGAVVHPVDVAAIYHFDGSVRCLVNVLRRR